MLERSLSMDICKVSQIANMKEKKTVRAMYEITGVWHVKDVPFLVYFNYICLLVNFTRFPCLQAFLW